MGLIAEGKLTKHGKLTEGTPADYAKPHSDQDPNKEMEMDDTEVAEAAVATPVESKKRKAEGSPEADEEASEKKEKKDKSEKKEKKDKSEKKQKNKDKEKKKEKKEKDKKAKKEKKASLKRKRGLAGKSLKF